MGSNMIERLFVAQGRQISVSFIDQSIAATRAVITSEGNPGVSMKKPLTMPDEQQPRNITRADILMTEGFGLEVDGRMKTTFSTQEAAQKSAQDLKARFPMLQVKVYDAAVHMRTLVKLPPGKIAVPIDE
jgi:hypothetical protein